MDSNMHKIILQKSHFTRYLKFFINIEFLTNTEFDMFMLRPNVISMKFGLNLIKFNCCVSIHSFFGSRGRISTTAYQPKPNFKSIKIFIPESMNSQ